MAIKKKLNRIWISVFIFLILFAIGFYLVKIRDTSTNVTHRYLMQERLIAKSNASNLESFLQMIGDFMSTRAQMPNIVNPDSTTTHDLEVFLGQWKNKGLINGIVLTDKDGIVRYNSNVMGTSVVGNTLAKTEYFIWAKSKSTPGQYFIGTPIIGIFGPSKGHMIIPITAGVFKNGEFNGILTSAVQLNVLTEQYLGLLRVSEGVYLFDKSGTVLYSSEDVVKVGGDVFDYLKVNAYLEKFLDKTKVKDLLNTEKSGSVEWPIYENGKKTGSRLVAYAPIDLGNLRWLLVLSNPEKDVVMMALPAYVKQTALPLVGSLILLGFGMYVLKNIKSKK